LGRRRRSVAETTQRRPLVNPAPRHSWQSARELIRLGYGTPPLPRPLTRPKAGASIGKAGFAYYPISFQEGRVSP
jgi:hypothetical protein